MSNFVRNKTRGIPLSRIIHGEVETWIVALVGWIPSVLGMAIRNVVYRLLGMKIKGFCWVQPRVIIVNVHKLKVGKNFGCNSGTYINAIGGLQMGDDVLVGSNVTISTGRHEIDDRTVSIISRPTTPLRTTIGDDVWIGAGASILAGVTVEDGTVVGANAVVTKDTFPYSVMVGAPARVVRYR
jgi:maltose O-acetyltransferase